MTTTTIPNWQQWLDRWEAQQDYVVHMRQERFAVLLDTLEILFSAGPFKILDLASGPGSISSRVLDRFPGASSVAVDLDPVLLAIGRNSQSAAGDRLRFIDADLRDPAWPRQVGETGFDAVLSTTALHWLPAEALVTTYRACFDLLRPGGVLINGGNMQFSPRNTTIRRVQEGLQAKRRNAITNQVGEGFQEWWESVGADSSLRPLYDERQRRFAWRDTGTFRPGVELHRAILLEAGFNEVDTILQHGHNRVLIAVR